MTSTPILTSRAEKSFTLHRMRSAASSVTQRIQRHYHILKTLYIESIYLYIAKTASICDIKDFSGNITDGIRQCGARCGRWIVVIRYTCKRSLRFGFSHRGLLPSSSGVFVWGLNCGSTRDCWWYIRKGWVTELSAWYACLRIGLRWASFTLHK